MIKSLTTLFLTMFAFIATAQPVWENRVFKATIKTIQCYNSSKEQSVPILTLGSNEQLIFSFDDLGQGSRDYEYAIEHCTSDWKSSRVTTADFVEGFASDRIMDYRLSFNTIQKYTHYELSLPNDMVRPKLSGNYILKVYETGNPQNVLITQRFYITSNQLLINAEIVPSSQVSQRTENQKVNFTINHRFPIANPYLDVKAIVMQNFDPLTAQVNTKPSFVRTGSIIYSDLTTNDFRGLNEFRKFDIRSLRFKGTGVQDIYRDSVNTVVLYQERSNTGNRFSNQFDENGGFFIRNQDGRDPNTQSDYTDVMFTLNAAGLRPESKIYVVGRFNNYTLNDLYRLRYYPERKVFYNNIQLKQGLYDYRYYVVGADGQPESASIEGTYFETENTYQIFVYYKRPGSRWEELAGYLNIRNLVR